MSDSLHEAVASKNGNNKISFSLSTATTATTTLSSSTSTRSKKRSYNKNDTTGFFYANQNQAIQDESAPTTIAEAAAFETERRMQEGTSLVIPLPTPPSPSSKHLPILVAARQRQQQQQGIKSKQTSSLEDVTIVSKDDLDAVHALSMEAMIEHVDGGSTSHNPNTISHLLIIPQKPSSSFIMTSTRAEKSPDDGNEYARLEQASNRRNDEQVLETDKERVTFQRDMLHRAEDLTVDSKAYVAVPITEFGAAMLRGMGWKEGSSGRTNSDSVSKFEQPRYPRLGLGAIPKMHQIGKDSGRKNAIGHSLTVQKNDGARKEVYAYQDTLQVGSIVWVDVENSDGKFSELGPIHRKNGKCKARIEKIAGVPGLNRVLILVEGTDEAISVKKGSLTLMNQEELKQSPFVDVRHANREKGMMQNDNQEMNIRETPTKKRHRYEENEMRKPLNERDTERSRNPKTDDRHHKGKHHHANREKSSQHPAHSDYTITKDQENDQKSHGSSWLLPNIRVRVVSRKVGNGKHFKKKGIIVDVLYKGAEAILQMDSGEVIERVPERYLVTALPKVGGQAIVVSGRYRYSKGTLLERDWDKDRGVIQLFGDLSLLKLSLDDIAEFCGRDHDMDE